MRLRRTPSFQPSLTESNSLSFEERAGVRGSRSRYSAVSVSSRVSATRSRGGRLSLRRSIAFSAVAR